MMDFLRIVPLANKRGVVEIYPRFFVRKSKDLMIRGGDFYAVWDQEKGMWSTDEDDLKRLVDAELDAYAEKHKKDLENGYRIMYMVYSETGSIDAWHKFCQHQMRDHYHELDTKLMERLRRQKSKMMKVMWMGTSVFALKVLLSSLISCCIR